MHSYEQNANTQWHTQEISFSFSPLPNTHKTERERERKVMHNTHIHTILSSLSVANRNVSYFKYWNKIKSEGGGSFWKQITMFTNGNVALTRRTQTLSYKISTIFRIIFQPCISRLGEDMASPNSFQEPTQQAFANGPLQSPIPRKYVRNYDWKNNSKNRLLTEKPLWI